MAAGMCTNGILRGRKKKKKTCEKTAIFMRLEPLNCLMLQGKPILHSLWREPGQALAPREREAYPTECLEGGSRPPLPLSHLGFSSCGAHPEGGMGLTHQEASHALRVCLKLETGIRKPSFYQENSSLLAFPLTDSDRN